MKNVAFAKTVGAAVVCGTGATASIVLFQVYGMSALWIAAVAVVVGFALAAIPIPRRRAR